VQRGDDHIDSTLPVASLRPGGWTATVGSILPALSIFGLGNLLAPFERVACRQADPGCTVAAQLANFAGKLDAVLSTVGVALLVVAGFFIASAMKRTPGWHRWARLARWMTLLALALAIVTSLMVTVGLSACPNACLPPPAQQASPRSQWVYCVAPELDSTPDPRESGSCPIPDPCCCSTALRYRGFEDA
jgi:hypothetical protein